MNLTKSDWRYIYDILHHERCMLALTGKPFDRLEDILAEIAKHLDEVKDE